MRRFAFRSSLFVPLLALGCGSTSHGDLDSDLVRSPLTRDLAPALGADDATTLALDNANFAFDLYHQLPSAQSTANFVYSPYSVSVALAMLYAGAAGATADEIRTALDFTLPADSVHSAFDAVDLALASRANGQGGSDGKKFALNVANSLWGDSTLKFEKPFLDTLAVDYGTGVHAVDFATASEAARKRINTWVSEKTDDRIEDLLPPTAVKSDTRFVLVNAIYFDAGWSTAFDPSATKPGAFHRLDGTTTMVDMMSATEEAANYAEGPNYQAVEVTYQGDKTSMVLVVPADGEFAAVEGALTGDFVTTLFSSLSSGGVFLSLPRFTVQGDTLSLKSALAALGMSGAFGDGADFSGVTTTETLSIEDVFHQAFVKVDETGTEAAAATAVVGTKSSAGIQRAVVNVDRPFFYFIRDIPTNTVLFVGRELDPA